MAVISSVDSLVNGDGVRMGSDLPVVYHRARFMSNTAASLPAARHAAFFDNGLSEATPSRATSSSCHHSSACEPGHFCPFCYTVISRGSTHRTID